jgi:uncharacterized protein (TIRG00374 family)
VASHAQELFRGRRWLLVAALVGLMLVALIRFTDLRALAVALAKGDGWWILAATAVQVLYFVLYALLYQYGFAAVEVDSRLRDLIPLLFASIFVNTVTVSAGAGAAALFIDDATKRGHPGARAAVGVVLVLTVDLLTLVPFIAIAVNALFLHRDLQLLGAIGGGIFVLYTLLLSLALLLAGWRPALLRVTLGWVERQINRVGVWFRRPVLLPGGWAERTAQQSTEATGAIRSHPRELAWAVLLGFVLHGVNLAGLYLLFLAFHQPVDLGVLLAGFGLGVISGVITVLPQGVAAVEGVMALVFASLGMPEAKAILITLAFRGLNFWLPLVIGFLFLRSTRSFGKGGDRTTLGPQAGPLASREIPLEDGRPDAGHPVPWMRDALTKER